MDNSTWFKDAVIYETHVKTFADSNGDGIGDFGGLVRKLDYLQNLGITAIWLLPFYPSPLRDDGYDIADYYRINPQFGTLDDFKLFLEQAHSRGLKVITELVLNHTSDQHAWFQRARRAPPGSPERDFYVWSDTPTKYQEARIIFKDFEPSNWSWDPVAKSYYWHRFFSHQPDLNYDNPEVEEAMFEVIDYWLELGVDGLRLDAVPYLYEREGTNCENLPETHACLQRLRAHIDRRFGDRMLLAEANQWPEDAVAYFGNGDKCHMAFHFPVMPRMFMALQMEDRFPILDILDQTPAIPESCQWAMFLRNHDELTLEMVTDEERDYMYSVYATDPRARINLGIRRRLAPLLSNSRRKIELINTLLFSLSGTPILYYGDEIGMGDNVYLGDRDGVRTPMQWSSDRNAGFSSANPQRLYLPITMEPEYHYETINVDTQERSVSSLLWWMRRLIGLRKKHPAFGRGTLEFVPSGHSKVLSYLRSYEEETILVIANLSRYSQAIELDLSRFRGVKPLELFGSSTFPEIRETQYCLSITGHGYYWLLLEKALDASAVSDSTERVTVFEGEIRWYPELDIVLQQKLEKSILPKYLPTRRWFGGKGRTVREIHIVEHLPIGDGGESGASLLFLQVEYTEGMAENYLLPVRFVEGLKAARMVEESPASIITRFRSAQSGAEYALYDASADESFRIALLDIIANGAQWQGRDGRLSGEPGKYLRAQPLTEEERGHSRVLALEQSNTSIRFGNRLFLKVFRKIEKGPHPDVEITRFLTEEQAFPHVPAFAGLLRYQGGGESRILGMLQAFVPDATDAWSWTCDTLTRFYERVLGSSDLRISRNIPDEEVGELIGTTYSDRIALLGVRTAELHLALASGEDPEFVPEPFSMLYQRSLYQSMRGSARRVFENLKSNLEQVPPEARPDAEELIRKERAVLQVFGRLAERKLHGTRIRTHGDYHLGQVLFTGKEFVILDFEGEPARPLSERRLKRPPLRDVAGMLRSFHYASHATLLQRLTLSRDEFLQLQNWAEIWSAYMGEVFQTAYLETPGIAELVPDEPEQFRLLLNALLLEKAIYEIGYEMNNRPDWLFVPIKGVQSLLG